MLLLFSGPKSRPDRLAAYLARRGCVVEEWDLLNHNRKQDLTDDTIWAWIEDRLSRGVYDVAFASPPCRTHSTSRRIRPGPPVVRTREYPLRIPRAKAKEYGLTDGDFLELRVDNLLASRTAEACRLQHATGGAVGVEQPAKRDLEHVCMFEREDFAALRKHLAVLSTAFDQCMYDGGSQKTTELLSHGMDFSDMVAKCNHPLDWHWVRPAVVQPEWVRATHPPRAGYKTEDGKWATAPSAQYPAKLNEALAKRIAAAAWRIFNFLAKSGQPPPAKKLVVPEATPDDAVPLLE